jgi:hypothetical protein
MKQAPVSARRGRNRGRQWPTLQFAVGRGPTARNYFFSPGSIFGGPIGSNPSPVVGVEMCWWAGATTPDAPPTGQVAWYAT